MGLAPESFVAAGAPVAIVDAWADDDWPDLQDVSGLVVFGGSMNVDQTDRFPNLSLERRLLGRALRRGTPVLGICLGAQLLARAMDQPVARARHRFVGFFPIFPTWEGATDPLVSTFQRGDLTFHWHEDEFDLPAAASLLATGEDGSVQAYRAGTVAWGLIFHPEVTEAELTDWIDGAGPAFRRRWGVSSEQLRAEVPLLLPRQQERARRLFDRFVQIARGIDR